MIPIDRLTDMRAPLAVIAERIGKNQFEQVYGVRLPKPAFHEPADRYRQSFALSLGCAQLSVSFSPDCGLGSSMTGFLKRVHPAKGQSESRKGGQ